MAAKQVYKIPYGLNESYLDMNISLNTKDGSIGRVFPLKVLIIYVGSVMSIFYLMMNTFIGTMSSIPQKILFVLLWFGLTILLAGADTTQRMNVELVPVLFNYLPKQARYIYTRTGRNITPFFNLVGIEAIYDDGLVEFFDGTVGYWYRVVGSASILLFDADRDAIIERVDNFFMKWHADSEIMFLTNKESQKVYNQVANLQKRYDNLKSSDKDLRNIAEEQFRILRDYVGKEFKSIHQYMLIKSANKEALNIANNIVQSEYENSALMIKQCVPLEYYDVIDIYKNIYQKNT